MTMDTRATQPALVRVGLAIAVVLGLGSWTGRAHAYGWMIARDYTGCGTCHADPSGGGLLTVYGRAQGEVLLRTRYSRVAADEEPGRVKDFLFGAFALPDSVLLGGEYRAGYLHSVAAGTASIDKFLQMQSDLQGQVSFGRVRMNASIGYDHNGAQAARLTSADRDNLISRVHWLGVDLGADNTWLVRVGRMNVPYGLRGIEHTFFIRSPTGPLFGAGVHDDINAGQQHGVALAYNVDGLRGELMLIAGNLQLTPAAEREQGYSGYLEWAPSVHVAVGVSTLITQVSREPLFQTALTRQAHGLFGRFSPLRQLTIMSEVDLLVNAQPRGVSRAYSGTGYAALLQADCEPVQGLHFILSGEAIAPPYVQTATSYGGWGSVAWFFAPHTDVRVDAILQSLGVGSQHVAASTLLGQLHVYL